MGTRSSIFFKTPDREFGFYINSSGYPTQVVNALWQIKMACDSGLLSWKSFYEFIKKYDGCSHTNYIRDPKEIKQISFRSFISGDLVDRTEPYIDSGNNYTYKTSYKLKEISEGEENYSIKKNARKYWIEFVFGSANWELQ